MSANRLALYLTIGCAVAAPFTLVGPTAFLDAAIPVAAHAGWLFAIGIPATVALLRERVHYTPAVIRVPRDTERGF